MMEVVKMNTSTLQTKQAEEAGRTDSNLIAKNLNTFHERRMADKTRPSYVNFGPAPTYKNVFGPSLCLTS